MLQGPLVAALIIGVCLRKATSALIIRMRKVQIVFNYELMIQIKGSVLLKTEIHLILFCEGWPRDGCLYQPRRTPIFQSLSPNTGSLILL